MIRTIRTSWLVAGAIVAAGAISFGASANATSLPHANHNLKAAPSRTGKTTRTIRSSASRITSVTFSGSTSAPMITIVGHGLGSKPAVNPTYQPAGHGGCAIFGLGGTSTQFGYDYGTSLYIHDSSTSPVWGAGRYRQGVGELDCVGLVVRSFSSTRVVLSLGAAYPNFPNVSATYNLKPGDHYDIHVNGAIFSGRVRYASREDRRVSTSREA